MNPIFENTLLFDFYGDLLTERQKELYQLYHQEDLSLGEISEQMGISRQGVYDAIKRCDVQLHHFEETLQLVHKYVRNKDRVQEVMTLMNDTDASGVKEKIMEHLESILEDL